MKARRITFIFQEPLTDDHKGILTVNFEALRDGAVKSMRNNLFNRAHQQFRDRLTIMANIMEGKIAFSFPKPNEAEFSYPIMDFGTKPVRIGNKNYYLGDIMPEKRIIRFITNDVSKDMGIDKETITYEVVDYEL